MDTAMLYDAAYGLYSAGHYEKAAGFFTQLTLKQPLMAPFWKGLAASKQMVKDYRAALRAWAVAAALDSSDPLAHLHAAEALYHLGQKEEAKKALNCAEALNNPDLKEKIVLFKELWA
jgi:tetratricopeptide (TPR) repeat protein